MFACLHLSRKKFNRIFPSLIDLLFMQWQAFWIIFDYEKKQKEGEWWFWKPNSIFGEEKSCLCHQITCHPNE